MSNYLMFMNERYTDCTWTFLGDFINEFPRGFFLFDKILFGKNSWKPSIFLFGRVFYELIEVFWEVVKIFTNVIQWLH